MLTRVLVALAIAASSLIVMPGAAQADEYAACMLRNGYFLTTLNDTDPPVWICPEPATYADCVG